MLRIPPWLAAACLAVACAAAPAATLDLQTYRGKVIYLDFWVSWCVPCRESFKWMNAMQESFVRQGFTVVAVNVDSDRTLAEKFLRENPANFAIVYDPQGALATQFQVQGMPTSILIDRDGHRLFQHTGFTPDKADAYETQIANLLAKKSG